MFVISGTIVSGDRRTFKKELEAQSEKHAKEIVYALFGSHNGLNRGRVIIEKVEKQ